MRGSSKKRFTEQMLERMNPPKSGRLELADDLCPGLVLRVTDAGVKSLSVIYRVAGEGGHSNSGRTMAGKQHRITLGRWPIVGLADARERARDVLRQAGSGADPRTARSLAMRERKTNTFAAVLQRHIQQDASRTISSWRNVERVLRLTGPASSLVERLPIWAGKEDYFLFSSQAGRTAVSGFSQAKSRLDELALKHLRRLSGEKSAKLVPYRVHDFRVTCETRLAHLGFGQDVRDAVLGHAKPGLQKTYNKYDYLDEKRAALTAYGERVMGVVNE